MSDAQFDLKTTRDAFYDKCWGGASTSDKIFIVAEYEFSLFKKRMDLTLDLLLTEDPDVIKSESYKKLIEMHTLLSMYKETTSND